MMSWEFELFEKTVYLASPILCMDLMHLKHMKANWESTVGANINEVERSVGEKIGCKFAVALSTETVALLFAVRLAGLMVYGQVAIGHGVLEGKKTFALI